MTTFCHFLVTNISVETILKRDELPLGNTSRIKLDGIASGYWS